MDLPSQAASLALLVLVASYLFQQEAAGYREVLARVPARATLLNLRIRTRPTASRPYTPPGLTIAEHAGGWWLFSRGDAK